MSNTNPTDMEYTIVWSSKIQDLINDVNALIDEGWRPQGGLVVESAFYQAMIREKK